MIDLHAKIGVVGAGTIGVGVAQSLAQSGYRVVLVDVDEAALARAAPEIASNLRQAALFDAAVRATDHETIAELIERTTDHERLADVGFIIENTTEDLSVKQALYPKLDRICGAPCIIAANSSVISITKLAAFTSRPDRVIGMHFMNPAPRKRTVEVIRGWHTSNDTVEAAQALLSRMGKLAIIVKDMPGFVSNRVLMLMINEAIGVVRDGVAEPRDVDAIFVQCFSHRMGPLATADLIGLDTILLSLEALQSSYGSAKYTPDPLLQQMVDAGLLGRKSGRGFFHYRHPETGE